MQRYLTLETSEVNLDFWTVGYCFLLVGKLLINTPEHDGCLQRSRRTSTIERTNWY